MDHFWDRQLTVPLPIYCHGYVYIKTQWGGVECLLGGWWSSLLLMTISFFFYASLLEKNRQEKPPPALSPSLVIHAADTTSLFLLHSVIKTLYGKKGNEAWPMMGMKPEGVAAKDEMSTLTEGNEHSCCFLRCWRITVGLSNGNADSSMDVWDLVTWDRISTWSWMSSPTGAILLQDGEWWLSSEHKAKDWT